MRCISAVSSPWSPRTMCTRLPRVAQRRVADADIGGSCEPVAPHLKRVAAPHAEFEEREGTLPQVTQKLLVDQPVGHGLDSVVPDSALWHAQPPLPQRVCLNLKAGRASGSVWQPA
jgi:hypothetical protein